MARYDDVKVPRGMSRRWEVLISDDEQRETPGAQPRTALDVRRDHRVLHDLPDELLRQIPLVVEGAALVRRREYIDLHDPARADFRAETGQVVRPGQRLVARDEVTDAAWLELRDACDRVVGRRPLKRAG